MDRDLKLWLKHRVRGLEVGQYMMAGGLERLKSPNILSKEFENNKADVGSVPSHLPSLNDAEEMVIARTHRSVPYETENLAKMKIFNFFNMIQIFFII